MINKHYILIVALLISFVGFSQNTITGVVTDEQNQPLLGVTILIKGTTSGTMTDFDGNFTLEATPESILSFSMIGMVSKNITVGNESNITVVLKQDVAELDEVVVVGYGSVAKKDLTGSVSTVKAETIESVVVANFDEALSGRIAGVNVSSNEGTPGEALQIVIRGGNSITSSNAPLYVVNGLPLEDFDPATISASDIETFQVLKDASATAIYGSRGANGVIVITTKSGKSNSKSVVTFDVSTSLQEITNTLEVLSPYQYVKYLETQAVARDGYQWLPDQGSNHPDGSSSLNGVYNKWLNPELYRDIEGRDFQKEAFNVAPMYRANFSIRGGGDKTNVAFSAGVVDQEGVLITTGFKRWNTNLTINHEISDKLKIWGAMNYSKSNRYGARLRNGRGNQLLKNIVLFRPVDALNPDGGEEDGEGGFIPGVNDNDFQNVFDPIRDMKGTKREDKAHNIRVNTTITWNINKDFTFKTTNGFNTTTGGENLFYSLDTQQGSRSSNGINGQINGYERSTFSTSNTLTFNKKFKRNRINAIIGQEYVHNTNWSDRLWNKNLPTDKFGINNLDIATQPTISLTNFSQNKLISFFGRANLMLNRNKYLLTATFRADGSSKFQGSNRWAYFPSFSGAWQVAEEGFMDNVNFVNSLKLRAGWGLTGNNRIGDYQSINQFGIGIWNGYAFGEGESYQPGATQSNFAVPDLRWETTGQTNIGLDFSMFDSRFSGTIDYYEKKTDDLLLFADMALSSGFGQVVQNVGSVSNKGLEVTLGGVIIDSPNFNWRSTINVSTNKNKVLSLNQGQEFLKTDPGLDWNSESYYISEVGRPVGMMYGLVYDRLYQVDDFIYDPGTNPSSPYILKEGFADHNTGVGPGSVKYVDQLTVDTDGDGIPDAGDGIINQDDRVVIGDPYPKHFGGFTNDFRYKNWDLSVLLQWSYDFDVFNANKALWEYPVNNSFSRLAGAATAWTPWNTDTDVVAHVSNGRAGWTRPGFKEDTRFIEDGSYLRLRTVNLGYNVPLDKKTGFSSLRLVASGQNLITWTDYSGFDPEVNVGGTLNPNLDYSAYPRSRTYSLSLIAKF
ncbi:SusC/RagA family TonB-linked outer membrane protein [Algibacter mikhailovii]|uniref:SusC/RagA family TonB-linked outer membrane protein n=1 Tax=Algibacter mikhailovii TaxID=425498 RepID=A0A918R5E1_9FLAO|nr:TonB-dependent receptor [Algibacter mikhailovii]GGZ87322.1 SusC/RagA family TonB-linked outer membrane protein [Algibacter mikhailovii]